MNTSTTYGPSESRVLRNLLTRQLRQNLSKKRQAEVQNRREQLAILLSERPRNASA